MQACAWAAALLFFVAFVIAFVQAPHVTWNLFVAAGLTAFALAYALSVSHITIS